MAVVGTITAPHRSGSANLRVELQLIQQLGQSAFLLHSIPLLSFFQSFGGNPSKSYLQGLDVQLPSRQVLIQMFLEQRQGALFAEFHQITKFQIMIKKMREVVSENVEENEECSFEQS